MYGINAKVENWRNLTSNFVRSEMIRLSFVTMAKSEMYASINRSRAEQLSSSAESRGPFRGD